MKNFKITTLIVAVIMLLASCGKMKNREVTVIRDCTGTYLRLDGKDYQVCNISKTNDYPEGTVVKASFKTISSCSETPDAVCELFHQNEGWIKVINIDEE